MDDDGNLTAIAANNNGEAGSQPNFMDSGRW